MNNKWLIVAGIFGLLAIFVAIPYVSEFASVDGCMDSGGSYDYVNGVCDRESNHPYVPYKQRNPLALLTFSGAAGMCAVAIVTSRFASRKS